jgi:hypothetical protein
MKLTKNDLVQMKNLTKAIAKGQWTLDGMEILAFSDMMRWVGGLQNRIEMELSAEEAAEKAKTEEQQKLNSGILEPKTVENPVKPIDMPKATNKKAK